MNDAVILPVESRNVTAISDLPTHIGWNMKAAEDILSDFRIALAGQECRAMLRHRGIELLSRPHLLLP